MRQNEREKGEGERHTGKNERQKEKEERETETDREREGGRESEKIHVRHILCYKMYKTPHGIKHHTQS